MFLIYLKGNNQTMKTLAIIILVVILVLILLSFPLGVKVFFYSNLVSNANFICIKLFGLFYICKKIDIQNGELILTSSNGDKKKIELKIPTKFQNNFFIGLIKEVGVDDLLLTFDFGSISDAFLSARVCGTAAILFSQLKVLLSAKKDVIISYKIDTNYNQDKLTLTAKAKLYFTLLGIITVFVSALFKSIGEKHGKKRQPN